MLWHCILLSLCWSISEALLCYNCSTSNSEWSHCGGDFTPGFALNNSRAFLVNCTGENEMCFVRSWRARAQHLWLVQRGCYQPTSADPLPRTMNIPTRAMTCKHERLPDAEYTVCLCQADWCNSSSKIIPIQVMGSTKSIFIFILIYIILT